MMANSGDTVSAHRLRTVIGKSGREDLAATSAVRGLASLGNADLSFGRVAKSELEHIYSRRLARPGFDVASVPGSDRVLDDLAGHDGDLIVLVTIEHEGSVIIVLLDSALRSLVSVMVGRDRRHVSPA